MAGTHRQAAPSGFDGLPLPRVQPLHPNAMESARRRLAVLAKPPGSLGVLEELAVQLAGISGQSPPPVLERKAILLFAADHGVALQGVSAYPQEVTAQMVATFLRGGAAINVLARQVRARLYVADVGVAAPIPIPADSHDPAGRAAGSAPEPLELHSLRIRAGTRDLTKERALTEQEVLQAIGAGQSLTRRAVSEGAQLLAFGEMGIGNTTAASVLASLWTGAPPQAVVGPGTGLDPARLARKQEVVATALARHPVDPTVDPIGALSAVGGLEVAAIAGGLLEAAAFRVPVVLDGFIVGAAALVAASLQPAARAYWIAGHLSSEPGHRLVLKKLGMRPLLTLEMRLGEGTGAALAFSLVEAAARLCSEMATLQGAHISGPLGDPR